jgi:hypothetical protein
VRILFAFLVFVGAGVSAFYGQPMMHNNADAVLVIATVMTVFAGFLVAIITILGDPAMIPEGSWRIAEGRRNAVEARLIAHIWLFVFYLIAIAFLFVGVMVDKAPETSVPHVWRVWIERLYIFFATASFLFTFALPRALWRFQLARLDAEIERRRKRANLPE